MNARPIRQLAAALFAGITLAAWAQASLAKEDPKSRLAKAEAMFAERCKKAGVFIHRTAENVEGIFLMKVRTTYNHGDQYRMDDPYGHDVSGKGYISDFLKGRNSKGDVSDQGNVSIGYRFVEAIDEKDGKRYRYTGSRKVVSRADPNAPNVRRNLQLNPAYDLNNYAFVLTRFRPPARP